VARYFAPSEVETGRSPLATARSRWKTESHFASWLGLCPDNRITGDKVRGRGTRRVVNRAATALRQAANTLLRSRSYLRAPKAITAMAHRLARLAYRMLKYGEAYVDKGTEYYEERLRQQQIQLLRKSCQTWSPDHRDFTLESVFGERMSREKSPLPSGERWMLSLASSPRLSNGARSLGVTTWRDCFQADQNRRARTQKSLSRGLSLGLGCFRFSTESHCRSAKFSRSRFRREREQRAIVPTQSRRTWTKVIADRRVEESVQIVDFTTG
jgi:hypothetical protein